MVWLIKLNIPRYILKNAVEESYAVYSEEQGLMRPNNIYF